MPGLVPGIHVLGSCQMEDVDGRDDAPAMTKERSPFGWTRAAAAGLTFRPIADADLPFLARVYASTRMEELVASSHGRTPEGRVPAAAVRRAARALAEALSRHRLAPGFACRRRRSAGSICRAGRASIASSTSRSCPNIAGRGSAPRCCSDLLDEAARAGKSLSIHVEKMNPAMSLYRRLGFVKEADEGVYDLMRWSA